jgi:hypothetical protein
VAERLASKGLDGLYSHTLFGFEEKLLPRLEQAIELGRSFIQPAYWGKRGSITSGSASGPIWPAIPNTATCSARHPLRQPAAGDQGSAGELLSPALRPPCPRPFRRPYPATPTLFEGAITGRPQGAQGRLDNLGCAIPPSTSSTPSCASRGVQFMDFGIDPDFNHCIDGLVWVDVSRIKPHKRARYIGLPAGEGWTLWRPLTGAATAGRPAPPSFTSWVMPPTRLRVCDPHGRDPAPGR